MLQCFDTIAWVPDMTYDVFGGTLNLALSIYLSIYLSTYSATNKSPHKGNGFLCFHLRPMTHVSETVSINDARFRSQFFVPMHDF